MEVETTKVVEIKILGGAVDIIGSRQLKKKVESSKKIEEIIDFGAMNLDKYILLVNGKPAKTHSEVSGDDEVVIMPRIGGG